MAFNLRTHKPQVRHRTYSATEVETTLTSSKRQQHLTQASQVIQQLQTASDTTFHCRPVEIDAAASSLSRWLLQVFATCRP